MAQTTDSNELLARFAALQKELESARAETEAAKAEAATARKQAEEPVSLSVGQKGGVHIRGIGARGVTLYKEQAERLVTFCRTDRIPAFIASNADRFKRRDEDFVAYWKRQGLSETEIADRVKAHGITE